MLEKSFQIKTNFLMALKSIMHTQLTLMHFHLLPSRNNKNIKNVLDWCDEENANAAHSVQNKMTHAATPGQLTCLLHVVCVNIISLEFIWKNRFLLLVHFTVMPMCCPNLVVLSLWQMRARQCVAHLLTCRAVNWARWASSYGCYVTRLWAPGTIFSLSSLALLSLLLALCQPGWWESSWCSMSATSRRKTNSSTWTTRKKPVRWTVHHEPGTAMGI